MRQAFYTIGKYINDPGYMATDEELKNMCSFVLTHGGRAILNDIILHGYIYAKGGVLQAVRSPNGNFSIDEQGNVVLTGNVTATSGSFGGFKITDKQMHSEGDGYTFDIYKDRIEYSDLRNKRKWTLNSTKEDGLTMTMMDESSVMSFKVGQYGYSSQRSVGLVIKGDKNHAVYSQNYFGISVAKSSCGFEFEISENFGNMWPRSPIPDAGMICQAEKYQKRLVWKIGGLPTSGDNLDGGSVYVENGYLKIKTI